MDDIMLMHVAQSFQHILHDLDSGLLLVHLLRLDSFEELSAIKVWEDKMNVPFWFVDLKQWNNIGVLQLSQDIYLLQYALDIPLALLDGALFYSFQRVSRPLRIAPSRATMDFREVTSAEKGPHFEFLFEV